MNDSAAGNGRVNGAVTDLHSPTAATAGPDLPSNSEPEPGPPGADAGAQKRADGSDVEFLVDELAAAARLPVRTVRHYQSEKVLQPPERRGRVAVYRREHLDRLRLIARLQDRGLQISAIRDALKRVEKGELWLEDWLGLGEELSTPWSEERPTVLTERELSERIEHRPGLVAALVEAGLVRREGGLAGDFLVRSPALLDITLQLDAAGVDVGTAAGAAAIMREHLQRATEQVVEYSLERTGEGFARSGTTEDIAEALDALRPLGARAVVLIFAQEMERALRHAVEKGRATPSKHYRDDIADGAP